MSLIRDSRELAFELTRLALQRCERLAQLLQLELSPGPVGHEGLVLLLALGELSPKPVAICAFSSQRLLPGSQNGGLLHVDAGRLLIELSMQGDPVSALLRRGRERTWGRENGFD